MLPALIISAGPVFSPGIAPRPGDIGQADWSLWSVDPDIITISGNGSSHFAALAASWKQDGHILPQLLAHYGRSASDYSSISLTGFSAGHGLFDPLLLLDADDITAAVFFDSCFTLRGGNGKSGYARFGAMAIEGHKLLVLTSSDGQNGAGLPPSDTGSECALASFQRALDATGQQDSPFDIPAGVPTTNPKGNFYGHGELETHHAGLFFVLDYGPLYFHGDHINLLSRDVLSAFLVPYLATGAVPGLTSPANDKDNIEPANIDNAEAQPADDNTALVIGAGLLTLLAIYALTRKP